MVSTRDGSIWESLAPPLLASPIAKMASGRTSLLRNESEPTLEEVIAGGRPEMQLLNPRQYQVSGVGVGPRRAGKRAWLCCSSHARRQLQLFEKAKEQNIIACLGTGSGKTLISVMLLKVRNAVETLLLRPF